jgi:ribose-phosphate pyrophosphokinase
VIKVNSVVIKPTIFPDGTSQVWKIPESLRRRFVHVDWHFDHEGEIMHLAQLKRLLDFWGVDAALRIPFLPYARQDKEISNGTTFALQPFAEIINLLNFVKVEILDPHSHEALKLINNAVKVAPLNFISYAMKKSGADKLCFPDAGAFDRYPILFEKDEIVIGCKIRNTSTGKILGYEMQGQVNCEGKSILIIDDICDGGATFVACAKELYRLNAKMVHLYVTHGIFSKGLKPLHDAGIEKIFTKDGEVYEFQSKIVYKPHHLGAQ